MPISLTRKARDDNSVRPFSNYNRILKKLSYLRVLSEIFGLGNSSLLVENIWAQYLFLLLQIFICNLELESCS